MNRVYRVLLVSVFFLFALLSKISAQLDLSVSGNGQLNVNNYSGARQNIGFMVYITGKGYLNLEEGWRVGVTAKSFPANNNKIFPAEKIFIETNSIEVQNDNRPPTMNQIGIHPHLNFINEAEVFFVPSALVSFVNYKEGSYYKLNFDISLGVEGGAYLGTLGTWVNYGTKLRFILYDKYGKPLGDSDFNTNIFVSKLSGTPPVENNFSISVQNGADIATLALNNESAYRYGIVAEYGGGLRVKSITSYELNVRSQLVAFTSKDDTSLTLPLDVVTVQLDEYTPVTLSYGAQNLTKDKQASTEDRYYKITYRTESDDDRLFNAKGEIYTTTLIYELVPD